MNELIQEVANQNATGTKEQVSVEYTDYPQNLRAEIVKRFMSNGEFEDFMEEYRGARQHLGANRWVEIPAEYYAWLDEVASGKSISQVAKAHGKTYSTMYSAVQTAALRKVLNG